MPYRTSHSRRRFLQAGSTLIAAAGLQAVAGASRQTAHTPGPAPAPGVRLNTPTLPDYSRDLERYLVRAANDARARRKRIVDAISTKQQVTDRQKQVIAELWNMLGGPFDRTPLNARVVGTLDRPGYRIEKVVFESRPRLFVTANLYVPAAAGRHPAILGPLGHSTNGKAWPSYQKLFSNLARKGYVVLAYDPFGQGERIEYPGLTPGRSSVGAGTGEHDYAGRRLILLGANFSLFRAWDGIRGIDYLLTRAEVDPDRIGCCGQSGGATMTQFLAALDDRIRAAVVSEGNSENLAEENAEPPGSADDAEQNIVPALARGIDRADLLYCFAPKPLLVTVTLHDAGHTYSPEYVAGSVEMLDEYRRAYAQFGAADRVSLQATTVSHGYVYEMRRATYAWFNKWLDVKGADDRESSQAVESEPALYVTTTGFVTTSLGGETALSLTRQMAGGIGARSTASPEAIRERVRRVLGIAASSGPPLAARVLATIDRPGYAAEQFELTTEEEIRTPGWLLTPANAGPSTPTLLYLGEASAWSSIAEDGLAERLCVQGKCRVAVIDVRGRGDCAIAYPPRGRFYFPERITDEAYLTWFTLMLGKPLIGGQVYDTLRTVEYLRSGPAATSPISLVGDGPHGVIALFAGALDPNVRGIALRNCITDYQSLATAERYSQPFGIYAYGLLKEFDLPDVARAAAPRAVLLVNPAGPGREAASGQERDAYKDAANVTIRTLDAASDFISVLAAWVNRTV